MISCKAMYTAVSYNHENNLSVPLIDSSVSAEQEEDQTTRRSVVEMEGLLSRLKTSSLALGILIGLFIQLSTLGANFLATSIGGADILTNSMTSIVLYSLAWSIFTSWMAIMILGFLRVLVLTSFHAAHSSNNVNNNKTERSTAVLDDWILHMECRFVAGALVGVCTAWTVTDALLGMNGQIVFSIVTLLVALSWCRFMLWLFAAPATSTTSENEPATQAFLV